MGVDYEGVYFFGLLYDGGDDTGEGGWPEVTRAVLGEDGDFEKWLGRHLGVTEHAWDEIKDLPQEERFRLYREREAQLQQRSLEVFGVEWETGWLGHLDFPTWYVYPKDARVKLWGGARVPVWHDVAQGILWSEACEKLRAVLPGAREPGFFFGCQVG